MIGLLTGPWILLVYWRPQDWGGLSVSLLVLVYLSASRPVPLAVVLGVPPADHASFVQWARGEAPAPAPPPDPQPPAPPPPGDGALAAAYAGCTPAERTILWALAVFADGAALDALESVLGA